MDRASRKSAGVNNFIIGAALLVAVQACTNPLEIGNSFLEEPPSITDVNQDSVFARADYANRFLTNAYRSLPYGPGYVDGAYDKSHLGNDLLESATDMNRTFGTGGGTFIYYNPPGVPYSSNNTKYNYNNSGAWSGMRQAYIFLRNVDRVPDMSESMKAQRKGEARMLIAVHYTEMFRHFGGLPWVDRPYGPNDDFELPRQTARQTLENIVDVIDDAIEELPFVLDNPETESGRFTKASAMGLKCRLLLFGASPLFNNSEPYMQGEASSMNLVWYGGEEHGLWQRAANACKELIDEAEATGDYHLLETGNPRQDFQDAYYQRDSPEILISTRVEYRSPSNTAIGHYYRHIIAQGGGATTDNYVQMFPMADGTPIDEPGSGYDSENPYDNRDPRLYETVLVNGDEYQGRSAELYIGGRERPTIDHVSTASGYRMRKFVLDGESALSTIVHYPYLRLPEIYLSYAEAINEANGGPTAQAYEYLNRVRNRVGLGDLPPGLSQEEFREAVIQERALEFGYEQVRWYDLARWKRQDDMTKPVYGMDITNNGDGTFSYERVELPRLVWQDDWSPQWYLEAFPRDEILKNYGLVQNPGWE
ncbi:MAG: RagB/SusD family nutrient uptake outer membrane protein [Balneolaceae bacterium]